TDCVAHARDAVERGGPTDLHLHCRERAQRFGIEVDAVDQRVHGHLFPARGRETQDPRFLRRSPAQRPIPRRPPPPGTRAHAPPGRAFDKRHDTRADPETVPVPERHTPTLTTTATTNSSRDVLTNARTSDGGSVRCRMMRTGSTASGNANRPSSAHGCVTPI